jgi:hypothetical protein
MWGPLLRAERHVRYFGEEALTREVLRRRVAEHRRSRSYVVDGSIVITGRQKGPDHYQRAQYLAPRT